MGDMQLSAKPRLPPNCREIFTLMYPGSVYQDRMLDPKPTVTELILAIAALSIAGFAFYAAAVSVFSA